MLNQQNYNNKYLVMSVYTKITKDALSDHLENYSIGQLVEIEGISDGIENTNYLLTTTKNEYIFTIFENIDKRIADKYLKFMNHLHEQEFKCALVESTNTDQLSIDISNKPSAIIQKLDGKSITETNASHCELVGELLSEFHQKSSNFKSSLVNSRDINWKIETIKKLNNSISKRQTEIINASLKLDRQLNEKELPKGKIHADLFRDNVLFNNDNISGMIDFYYSCDGILLYDIAVVANDWCTSSDGSMDQKKLHKLFTGYEKNRKIQDNERGCFPFALASAGLRFYLSRLHDLHFPKIGEMTHIKDPSFFENILLKNLNSIDIMDVR